jgi:DNA-binding transcriptional regulator YiaG
MNKKYQSEALMVSHQAAQDLIELGVIDAAEMREFDKECLVPEPASQTSGARQVPVPAYTSSRQV